MINNISLNKRKNKSKIEVEENSNKFNSISKPTNVILNILFGILAALCIIPFVFVLIISLTSEQSLQMNGYRCGIICKVEYYSAMRKMEILAFATT